MCWMVEYTTHASSRTLHCLPCVVPELFFRSTCRWWHVLPLIFGDSAYALSSWLMKPYIDRGNLTPEECSFNIKHNTARVVVENAFGRLKGRFRSIGKRLDLKVENACNVIAACCVLHNYCEMQNESFDDQWLNDIHIHARVCPGDPNQRQNPNAIAIREAIKRVLI